MKQLTYSLYILLLLGGILQAQTGAPLRQIHNSTFQKGEFLKFRVHYGFVTAGFATLEVAPKSKYVKGRPCHHILFKGFTSPTFDVFYKVRDTYESYFDEEALLSWRFNRTIKEGGFSSYSETHFNHYEGKAHYYDKNKRHTKYDIPSHIQDVISAFYFARTRYQHNKLKIGDRINMRNFIDRKTFALEARLQKKETIKVNGTKYKALKFDLLIDESGLITDGSKIKFWISDDANKIPLRIESELVVGSIKADLIEYKNLKHPFSAKIKK